MAYKVMAKSKTMSGKYFALSKGKTKKQAEKIVYDLKNEPIIQHLDYKYKIQKE